MKTAIVIVILALIPLVLMGSFLKLATPAFGVGLDGKFNANRSWRVDTINQEQYTNNAWYTTNQYEMVYSSQYPTRLDTLKYYGWDNEGQDWVLFATFAYTYDSTQEYVTHSDVSMMQGGFWFPFMRSNFTYDNQHRLTYALIEMYSPQTQVWSVWNWTKVDFVSSSNYVVWQYVADTESRVQQWMKMLFTWDSQGRIVGETDMVSADSVNWVNSEQYSRTYHPHDTTTGDIFISNFSHFLPQQNMLEDAYSYDFMGMLSYEMNRYWSGTAWQDTYQTYYTYDAADHLIQDTEQQWMNNTWNSNFQIIYTYDANGNQDQSTISYNQSGTLAPEERYTFTWEQTTANADNTMPTPNGLNLAVSPNPFSNSVSLTVNSKTNAPAEVKIYNLLGQQVRTLPATSNSRISWDGNDKNGRPVANGIYFAHVTSGNQTGTVKLLKVR